MRKKAVALAVAGVFAAPAAVLAQSSTVQIYGKLTYEYAVIDPGNYPNGEGETFDNADNPGGSNIGFRGEEKLGGGLSAWFQCESSADVTGQNQDGLCTRNSAVGFKGGWGNLHFGRWDAPFKRALNQGSTGAIGETGALGTSFVAWGGSGGTNATTKNNRQRWKRRDVGWVYYESPKFSGAQVLAGWTPGNGANGVTSGANNTTPRVASIGVLFNHGPLSLGAGYEQHSDFGTAAATSSQDDKGWGIAASYTFAGKIEVGATYMDNKYEQQDGDIKRKSWTLGVDWAIAGPHSVRVFYAEADKTKGSSTVGISPLSNAGGIPAPCTAVGVCGADNGAKDYSIGYGYAFSKRTLLQIGLHITDNDSAGTYANGNADNPAAGEKQKAYGFHIAHRF